MIISPWTSDTLTIIPLLLVSAANITTDKTPLLYSSSQIQLVYISKLARIFQLRYSYASKVQEIIDSHSIIEIQTKQEDIPLLIYFNQIWLYYFTSFQGEKYECNLIKGLTKIINLIIWSFCILTPLPLPLPLPGPQPPHKTTKTKQKLSECKIDGDFELVSI